MEFYKKYRHVGYSYCGVPYPWRKVVEKAIIEIEKEMWPRYIPMFIKRWIHYLATGNSVVRIKYWWANRLRDKLTDRQIINDIKTKYGDLRIYYYGNKNVHDIVSKAIEDCSKICEYCGSTENVEIRDKNNWYYNLCDSCSNNKI